MLYFILGTVFGIFAYLVADDAISGRIKVVSVAPAKPKSKRGRKPKYTTDEERRQARNRAQRRWYKRMKARGTSTKN